MKSQSYIPSGDDVYPDSYPRDVGEAADSPELTLSELDNLLALSTLRGERFSFGFWTDSL